MFLSLMLFSFMYFKNLVTSISLAGCLIILIDYLTLNLLMQEQNTVQEQFLTIYLQLKSFQRERYYFFTVSVFNFITRCDINIFVLTVYVYLQHLYSSPLTHQCSTPYLHLRIFRRGEGVHLTRLFISAICGSIVMTCIFLNS